MSDDLQFIGDAPPDWDAAESHGDEFTGGFVGTVEGAGSGVMDAAGSVVDVFVPETVEAEAPDLSSIPTSAEDTSMRSSSTAHEEAPPAGS